MKIINNQQNKLHIPTFLKTKILNRNKNIQMNNSLDNNSKFDHFLNQKIKNQCQKQEGNHFVKDTNLKALAISFLRIICYEMAQFEGISNLSNQINNFINAKENHGIIETIKNNYQSNLPTQSIIAILKCSLRILQKSFKNQLRFENSLESKIKLNKILEDYFFSYSFTLNLFIILFRSVLYKVKFMEAVITQKRLQTKEIYFILCDYFNVRIQQINKHYILAEQIVICEFKNFKINLKSSHQNIQDQNQCLNYEAHLKTQQINQECKHKNETQQINSTTYSKSFTEKCFHCEKKFKLQTFCKNVQLTIFPDKKNNSKNQHKRTPTFDSQFLLHEKYNFKVKKLIILDNRPKKLLKSLNYNNSQIKLRIKLT